MKRSFKDALLGAAGLLAILAGTLNPSTSHAQQVVNNGLPQGYPESIFIQRVPGGSGTPSVGVQEGLEEADHVRDGLYHVPGYMPFDPSAGSIYSNVVTLHCRRGVWICDGYSINPGTTRGENILIQPVFDK